VTNRFEIDPDRSGELDAPIGDVAQEAIDATAATYASDAGIDVEEHLSVQLRSRGLRADAAVLAELARDIRSGHHVREGRPDGSVDG